MAAKRSIRTPKERGDAAPSMIHFKDGASRSEDAAARRRGRRMRMRRNKTSPFRRSQDPAPPGGAEATAWNRNVSHSGKTRETTQTGEGVVTVIFAKALRVRAAGLIRKSPAAGSTLSFT